MRSIMPVQIQFRTMFMGATLAFLVFPDAVFSHAGIDERLAAITKQIAAEPARADLYIKRGELHRLHRDWQAALGDFEKAGRLDPSLEQVLLSRGRVRFERGEFTLALVDLDRYIAKRPDDPEARLVRARTFRKLKSWPASVREYDALIDLLPNPAPEYYLERAEAEVAQGDIRVRDALAGLDQGIAKLGPIVTLQDAAIELELRTKSWDGALDRLDTLARWLAPERLWQRRGKILAQAGRFTDADLAFCKSLEVLAGMPPRRRNDPMIQQFERQLRAQLSNVQGERPDDRQ